MSNQYATTSYLHVTTSFTIKHDLHTTRKIHMFLIALNFRWASWEMFFLHKKHLDEKADLTVQMYR